MVRLKDSLYQTDRRFTDVSIPYGSIKSRITDLAVSMILRFQFLMVRLKEPFGDRLRSVYRWFQFLMVRLKGDIIMATSLDASFQFLMVRLKGRHALT